MNIILPLFSYIIFYQLHGSQIITILNIPLSEQASEMDSLETFSAVTNYWITTMIFTDR